MKQERVRQVNRIACGKFYRQGQIGDENSMRRSKFYSKLVSCGKLIELRDRTVKFHCRLAACCKCSEGFAKRQADAFMSQFPLAGNDKFRLVTIGIDTCYEIEEVFHIFRTFRGRLGRTIHNLRRRKSSEWGDFSMVGSLEVDAYKVSDFCLLGQEKQRDFLDNYGFKPEHIGQDTLWHIHFHGIIHVDLLQENTIVELLSRHSRTVHIKPLDVANTSYLNVCNILGYSNKVRYQIKLKGDRPQEWDYRQVEDYAGGLSNLRGRQGHKLLIKNK